MAEQTTEISIDFLTELLEIRRQHNIVCDLFRIPVADRGKDWVGSGIKERISQYVTSYVMRKSMAEKESGAAFREEIAPLLPIEEKST